MFIAAPWEGSGVLRSACVFVCLCLCVCMSVCLRAYLWNRWTKFLVQIPCGHSSVLLWQHCDMLCTSSFMDDTTFGTSMAMHARVTLNLLSLAALWYWVKSDVYECLVVYVLLPFWVIKNFGILFSLQIALCHCQLTFRNGRVICQWLQLCFLSNFLTSHETLCSAICKHCNIQANALADRVLNVCNYLLGVMQLGAVFLHGVVDVNIFMNRDLLLSVYESHYLHCGSLYHHHYHHLFYNFLHYAYSLVYCRQYACCYCSWSIFG